MKRNSRARWLGLTCSLWFGSALGCASEVGVDGNAVTRGPVSAAVEGGADGVPEAPEFGEVYAILSASCGGGQSGCHVSGMAAKLALPDEDAAHAALVEVSSGKCEGELLVVPGDAEASVLVQALEGTSACVKAMPLGRDQLASEEIAIVRAWIDAGAVRD